MVFTGWGTTKALIRSLNPETSFSPEQVALRNAIGERLSTGLQAPMATQLLLANFLYSPPGLLQIADAHSHLPGWLYEDYRSIYEQTASSSPANSQFNLQQSCPSLTLVLSSHPSGAREIAYS